MPPKKANPQPQPTPEEQVRQEAGLPSNWQAADVAPIVPGREAGAASFGGAPPISPLKKYFSGSLPPAMSLTPDLVDAKYQGGSTPLSRLMPVGAGGNPNVVSAVQSVSAPLIAAAIAAIPPPPTVTQTGGSYVSFFWPEAAAVSGGGTIAPSGGVILFYAFQLPASVPVNSLGVSTAGFSPADICDWGIYNLSGTRIFDIGAQSINNGGSNTVYDIAVVTPGTLTPGNYFFAITSKNGQAGWIGVGTETWFPYSNGSSAFQTTTTSTGGQLPVAITLNSFAPLPANIPTPVPKWFTH